MKTQMWPKCDAIEPMEPHSLFYDWLHEILLHWHGAAGKPDAEDHPQWLSDWVI